MFHVLTLILMFYKPLTEDDIQFVKETTEEEERQFEIERAQVAARSAFSQSGGGAGEVEGWAWWGACARKGLWGGRSGGKRRGKSNGREREKGGEDEEDPRWVRSARELLNLMHDA